MNQESEAAQYQKIRHTLIFTSFVVDATFLLVYYFSGLSSLLAHAVKAAFNHSLIITAVYIIIFSVMLYALHCPLNFYSEFQLEHRFKLSNQNIWQWLKDDAKKAAISLIFILILVEAVYVFLTIFPENWWVAAGIFWIFFSFVIAQLTPKVLIPLFFEYGQIADGLLKNKIKDLFNKCGLSLNRIYSINLSEKSKKASAFLCGIGKNRRVVLSDTLIDHFTSDEIEVIVAHELGHYKHRDILKLLLFNSVTVFVGLYLVNNLLALSVGRFSLSGIDDISFFPILALLLIIFSLVVMPLTNGFSRIIEKEADRFSLKTTGKAKEFISVMNKLACLNLAEKNPGRFVEILLYDHPSIAKRIAFAESFYAA